MEWNRMNAHTGTLSIDIPATNETVLRITVYRTDSGSIDLDNILEVAEYSEGDILPVCAYTVQGFFAAGGNVMPIGHDGLTIEQGWMNTLLDWIVMAAENLGGSADSLG